MHKSRKLFVVLNVYQNEINKINIQKITKQLFARKNSRQEAFSFLEDL